MPLGSLSKQRAKREKGEHMIEAVIALVVGVGLGYGFRGLINKNIKTVGADVKTTVTTAATDVTKKL